MPRLVFARAVVVEEGALVHTALMFPEDGQGRLQGEGDAGTQATRVLANIDVALKAARTSLTSLVRLHVYVADASVTPQIGSIAPATPSREDIAGSDGSSRRRCRDRGCWCRWTRLRRPAGAPIREGRCG